MLNDPRQFSLKSFKLTLRSSTAPQKSMLERK